MQQSLGQKIRDLRIKRGLTQGELAQGLVTPSMISQIESDKAFPSHHLLVTLSARLGVSLEYFFTEPEVRQEKLSLYRLAVAYVSAGRFPDALRALEEIGESISNLVSHIEIQYHIAVCLVKLDRHREAESILDDLLEETLSKEDHGFYLCTLYQLGRLYERRNNREAAIYHWNKAIQAAQFYEISEHQILGQIYPALGRVYEEQEDWHNAEIAYRAANQRYLVDTDMTSATKRLLEQAEQSYRNSHFKQAMDQANQVDTLTTVVNRIEMQADNVLRGAIALARIGQPDKARNALKELQKQSEWYAAHSLNWHIAKAEVEYLAGNVDTACTILSEHLSDSHPDSNVTANGFAILGDVLLHLKKFEQSEAALRSALEWYLDQAQAAGCIRCYRGLSQLYKEVESYSKALACHERMHELMAMQYRDGSRFRDPEAGGEGISPAFVEFD